MLDILHNLGRAVASKTSYERYARGYALLYDVQYVAAVGRFDGGRLGRCAECHDIIRASVYDVVYKALQSLYVIRKILLERCYQGGACAAESACIHILLYSYSFCRVLKERSLLRSFRLIRIYILSLARLLCDSIVMFHAAP